MAKINLQQFAIERQILQKYLIRKGRSFRKNKDPHDFLPIKDSFLIPIHRICERCGKLKESSKHV